MLMPPLPLLYISIRVSLSFLSVIRLRTEFNKCAPIEKWMARNYNNISSDWNRHTQTHTGSDRVLPFQSNRKQKQNPFNKSIHGHAFIGHALFNIVQQHRAKCAFHSINKQSIQNDSEFDVFFFVLFYFLVKFHRMTMKWVQNCE